jgi:hypothetical protein
VTSGFIAAGLARLREIGRETGVDWRSNRSWLGTVFGVLVVVVVLGLPASMLLGLPGDAVARGVLGPIVTLLGYLFIGALAMAAGIAALLARTIRSFGVELPAPAEPLDPAILEQLRPYTVEELSGPIAGLVAVWVVIGLVLVVLVRVWLRRRPRRGARPDDEERRIQLPDISFRRRASRRAAPPRGSAAGRPTDAVAAYLAALSDIAARRPADARAEHETPRAHAGRVRIGPELDALQADYALARYAGRHLTHAEHRRAISRWRRLRRRLSSA